MDQTHPFRSGLLTERIRHLAEYLPLRSLSAAIQCVGEEQNLRSADLIASIYSRISTRRCNRASENVRRAFPNLSEKEVDRIVKKSIQYMFRLFLVDSMAMPRLMNTATWHQHIQLNELTDEVKLLSSNKPCLMIGAHCGNWELLGFALAALGFPMTALARPLDNPYLDHWLRDIREQRGLRVLTKWGATDQIVSMINGPDPAGKRIGFIADQNAGSSGLFVPFLGKLASSYKSIGLLAMRYELPILIGYAPRIGNRFQYRFEAIDTFGPEDWCDQSDPLFYITARFNHGIERMVQKTPEQYLWIHRRWKSRPKWELQGKQPPAALQRRMEELPWMTTEEITRVLNQNRSAGAAR
jgi:KDO2-lipid IV(A) lauroyltransferase